VLLEISQRKFIISQSGSQFHLQLSGFSYSFLRFTMSVVVKTRYFVLKSNSILLWCRVNCPINW